MEFRSAFEWKLFYLVRFWHVSALQNEEFINFSVTIFPTASVFHSSCFPFDSIELWTFARIIINYIIITVVAIKRIIFDRKL